MRKAGLSLLLPVTVFKIQKNVGVSCDVYGLSDHGIDETLAAKTKEYCSVLYVTIKTVHFASFNVFRRW